MEEKIVQTTTPYGEEVILKKDGSDVFYRRANEYGAWQDGIPDGLVWSDVQSLFDDSAY